MSTHASSTSWARHLRIYEQPGRATAKNDVLFISFGSSRYARMAIATLAGCVETSKKANIGPKRRVPAVSAAAETGSATTAGAGAEGSGGGGGNADGDGDGDSDGDGPRRKSSLRRKSSSTRVARRRPSSLSKIDPERAHGRALFAFTVVTAIVLATFLTFGLNGQTALAEKVLGAFVSIGTVAAAFLRPK